jgi:hypothetical protein
MQIFSTGLDLTNEKYFEKLARSKTLKIKTLSSDENNSSKNKNKSSNLTCTNFLTLLIMTKQDTGFDAFFDSVTTTPEFKRVMEKDWK